MCPISSSALPKLRVILPLLSALPFLLYALALLIERFFHVLLDQNEVRRHALLPSVEAPQTQHTLRRQAQIGVLRDEHRVLSAQFQRHGRQVLRCLLHDHATHLVVAREEDIVELLSEEGGGGVAVSLLFGTDDLNDSTGYEKWGIPRWVHVFAKQTRDELGAGGRYVGRLDDRHVSSTQCASKRHESQHEGIVPGSDDESDSVGLRNEIAAREESHQVTMVAGGSGPLGQTLDYVVDIGFHAGDVVHDSLEGVSVQVLLHGSQNLFFVFVEEFEELLQLLDSLLDIECFMSEKRLAHFLHKNRNVAEWHGSCLANVLPLLVGRHRHHFQTTFDLKNREDTCSTVSTSHSGNRNREKRELVQLRTQ